MTPGLVGSAEPRVATPLPDGESRTDEVNEVAERWLGFSLDPWQRILVDYLSTPDHTGHPPGLVAFVVARQNGKTTAMQAYCLWQVLNGRKVLSASHSLRETNKTFRPVADLFDPHNDSAPLRHLTTRFSRSAGDTEFELADGGAWYVRAANDKAARGMDGISTIFLDELRSHHSWGAWDAITPTASTGKDPQIICASNAGDLRSTVLNNLTARGRKRAVGFANGDPITWLEWSADPSLDLDDREGWAQANPALGDRLPWSVLEGAYFTSLESGTMDGWRTERLCQSVGAMGSALDVNQFRRLVDTDTPPQPADRDIFLAVTIDLNRRGAAILVGRQRPDGVPQVGVLTQWEADRGAEVSDRDVADELVTLYEKWRPTHILYNSFLAAGVAHLVTRRRLPMLDMKGRKYFDACQILSECIRTGNLAHDGHPAMVGQVGVAVRETLRNGDGFMFSRRSSPGPIYLVDGLAMLTHQTSKRRSSRSGVVTLAS